MLPGASIHRGTTRNRGEGRAAPPAQEADRAESLESKIYATAWCSSIGAAPLGPDEIAKGRDNKDYGHSDNPAVSPRCGRPGHAVPLFCSRSPTPQLMSSVFVLPYGPLVIFALRIVDVSLGTVRMILMVRGRRGLSAAIGFVEVLVWIVAVGSALQHLGSSYHVVGYAGGFAAGTYVGLVVEDYLAVGTVVVRAIIPNEASGSTAEHLRAQGFAVTEIDGRGRSGPVDVLNVVVKRAEAPRVVEAVESEVPDAFITVEEIRSTRRGRLLPSRRISPRLFRK